MKQIGIAGRTASAFINSKLTPLIILAALLFGAMAVMITPREEEPQIIVPMMDVFVQFSGASPEEVESRITSPMERKIWEIPGVEYVYSMSRPGLSIITVRFYVGEDVENSLVNLYDKLMSNMDMSPPGASPFLVKPKSIDDVPILAMTLWGGTTMNTPCAESPKRSEPRSRSSTTSPMWKSSAAGKERPGLNSPRNVSPPTAFQPSGPPIPSRP